MQASVCKQVSKRASERADGDGDGHGGEWWDTVLLSNKLGSSTRARAQRRGREVDSGQWAQAGTRAVSQQTRTSA